MAATFKGPTQSILLSKPGLLIPISDLFSLDLGLVEELLWTLQPNFDILVVLFGERPDFVSLLLERRRGPTTLD